MEGVTFGGVHSYRDLKLLLEKKTMGSPPVKENYMDIPGADGKLDNTEFFGEPKFDNATHKFEFVTIEERDTFPLQYAVIKNALHGKKVRIICDDDPSFFYVGRLHVSSFTNAKGMGAVSVECDCEPWKYKLEETTVTAQVDGEETIVLTNSRRRAVPLITIEAETSLRITYQTYNVWDLSSGTYTLPELEIVQGENPVTVTGTGSISFTWREADL